MTPFELDAALEAAFNQCDTAQCPLSDRQKQILRQALQERIQPQPEANRSGEAGAVLQSNDQNAEVIASQFPERGIGQPNPLDQLAPEERQALLEFVRQQESQNLPWKMTLLNDWLQGNDSGSVQFIRNRYGIQWLDQVKPVHLSSYDGFAQAEMLKLKPGDRIEVTNGLWEWVQEEGPCSREWFPCTVVSVNIPPQLENDDAAEQSSPAASCIVRFDSGAEYEIQGIYDWNRPNWRWLQE